MDTLHLAAQALEEASALEAMARDMEHEDGRARSRRERKLNSKYAGDYIAGEGRAKTTNGKIRDQITARPGLSGRTPADPDKHKVGPAFCVAEKRARRVGLRISSRRPCVVSVVHDCSRYVWMC